MLDGTDSTILRVQTFAAQRKRDAPGSAHARLRGLAHLPDSLGPQLDLHLHSTWTAGRTSPEPLFLPALMPARDGLRFVTAARSRRAQEKLLFVSYRECSTETL